MTYETPWQICATCQAIPLALFQEGIEAAVRAPHLLWSAFTSFAESAATGCHTCTLLFGAVKEPFKHQLKDEAVYVERAIVGDAESAPVALTVDAASLVNPSSWIEALPKHDVNTKSRYQFLPIADVNYVIEEKDVPVGARHFKDLVSLYAEDDGMFRYVKQSLTNCLTNHNATCNRVMFPLSGTASRRENTTNIVTGHHGLVVAPTRLIYVGSENPKDPPVLVDGQQSLYKGGYLALSYCWGMTPKAAPWHLTSKTMPLFSTEIPLDILPQTLHDAIMWTRKLGELYIWIDSMCILQDSKEDWDKEASRMASIYGSATMTIIAASSSVYGGLSNRRNPLRNTAASLRVHDDSAAITIYVLPNGQPGNMPLPPPTESRAWCYQEDLLSSRAVKLTQKSVLWQCVGDGSTPNTRAQGVEQISKHPPYRWYTLWYRFVELYSNRSITYSKDKLLAFFGIACDKAGSAYLAGFLRSDPWVSLLWCRNEDQIKRRPGHRYEEYTAPTWSWASIDAPVLFYEANARHWRNPQLRPSFWDPELHDAQVKSNSYFETGAVVSGSIEMSAYVAIVQTTSVGPSLFNTRYGAHTYGRRNCVDPFTGRVLGLIVFDIAAEAEDDMLLCCALLSTADMGLWEKNGTAGLGLALVVPKVESEQMNFSRVGYVQFTSDFSAVCHRHRLKMS